MNYLYPDMYPLNTLQFTESAEAESMAHPITHSGEWTWTMIQLILVLTLKPKAQSILCLMTVQNVYTR